MRHAGLLQLLLLCSALSVASGFIPGGHALLTGMAARSPARALPGISRARWARTGPGLCTMMDVGSAAFDVTRARIRLEGLNTYGVVSALVMNASLRLFTTTNVRLDDGRFDKYISVLFLIGLTGCVLCGAYTTVIFTLIQLYAKTSLGMSMDERYETFFRATQPYRVCGFRTFLACLCSFCGSFSLAILLKLRKQPLRWVFFSISAVAGAAMSRHWFKVVALASEHIFAVPPGT